MTNKHNICICCGTATTPNHAKAGCEPSPINLCSRCKDDDLALVSVIGLMMLKACDHKCADQEEALKSIIEEIFDAFLPEKKL